ncbi:alanine--tRNA ligase-related protein [Kitasatospora sp. NPDC048194]|uniref:alanine--tRNA ligase-related protein n=1 Tax=Kitasatospora sp. NPDC048194 TaxID=3364045 RepID=UPI003713E692
MGELITAVLGAAGYRRQLPTSLVAERSEPTLFTSAAARSWRQRLLAEVPRSGSGSMTLQWCVRTSRLEALPVAAVPTADRVAGALWHGRRRYVRLLGLLLEVLGTCGVDLEAVGFLVSARPEDSGRADGRVRNWSGDEDARLVLAALTDLGVGPRRVAFGAPPPGVPDRLAVALGPVLTVVAPTGPFCSATCDLSCPCGGHLQLAHVQFVERRRSAHGHLARRPHPVFELLVMEHAVRCAVAGTRDPAVLHGPLTAAAGRLLPRGTDRPARSAAAVRLLTDHARTAALLLGEGLTPGARGQAHVLRRLLRRAAAEVMLAGGDPGGLGGLVGAADRATRVPLGLAPLSAVELAAVAGESAALERAVEVGRDRFRRARGGLRDPERTAAVLLRLRSEHGVPLAVSLAWCREEAVEVSLLDLAVADHELRAGNRA